MTDIKTTLDERGKRYGKYRDTSAVICNIKRAMSNNTNFGVLPAYMREALDMVAHKAGRVLNGDPYYLDSWRDMIGFLQLVVDILETTEGATDSRTVLIEYTNGNWEEPHVSVTGELEEKEEESLYDEFLKADRVEEVKKPTDQFMKEVLSD